MLFIQVQAWFRGAKTRRMLHRKHIRPNPSGIKGEKKQDIKAIYNEDMKIKLQCEIETKGLLETSYVDSAFPITLTEEYKSVVR